MKTYTLICNSCGKTFARENKQKYKNRTKQYCSRECSRTAGKPPIATTCGNCGKSIIRRNDQLTKSKSKLLFCSRSCSASFNNKRIKRKLISKLCKTCRQPVPNSHRRLCDKCCQYNAEIIANTTLKTLSERRQDGSKYSPVRYHSRWLCRKLPQVCSNCQYNKHVEVAHIKPVKSFGTDTTIREINNPNNLSLLCPNCHWELDHDLLSIDKIRTVASIGLEPTTSD